MTSMLRITDTWRDSWGELVPVYLGAVWIGKDLSGSGAVCEVNCIAQDLVARRQLQRTSFADNAVIDVESSGPRPGRIRAPH